jgi:hypothetical protein
VIYVITKLTGGIAMDRKEMIRLLEAHSGAKAKYMGVPSCCYKIEIKSETYSIEKDGIVKDKAGNEVDFESLLQSTVEGEPEAYVPTATVETENTVEIAIPMEGHTGGTLRNLVNMIYSKQVHLKKALSLDTDIVSAEFVEAVNDDEVVSQENFRHTVIRLGEERCPGIAFEFEEDTITFKFGIKPEASDTVDAVTKLAALLSKSAKEQKYASYKPSAEDNLKFTMRTWLIRLGFVGNEYKAARKTLLKSLEGNGAFRRPKQNGEAAGI